MTSYESLPAVDIAAGLWQIPLPIHRHSLGGSNAFLIRDREGYLLFDCGAEVPECTEALRSRLGELGVPFEAIHTLVLSHAHGDHAGLAASVAQWTGAQVAYHPRDSVYMGYPNASEADRQQLIGWLRRYGYPHDEIDALIGTAAVNDRGDRRDRSLDADRWLEGGEVLEVGRYRFEVLWTPGHTPGHLCLIDRKHSILLCGDHILEIVTPNVGLHPLIDGNPMPGYFASIREFASLNLDAVLPGHGPPIASLGGRVTELERRHADRRDQIFSLLTAVPQSPYELAMQVWAKPGRRNWANLHPHLRRNAVGMLAAHLEVLAETEPGVSLHEEDAVIRYSRRS
jgi:glyoxylase-like metal-dependent hydrolase (beta-lactamase superfamily II)